MRKISPVVLASICALALATGASAHVQTVAPPGQDAPVLLNDPISNPFAQAHCHAEAPTAVLSSDGVVSFLPLSFGPCPPVPNPGGQVTGP
jgi:hypothetical protein